MKIGQVLKEIGDGITKDHIYYWEKIGFLKPKLIKKTKIERKEYFENDLKKIKLVWKYINEGFSLKASFNKAIVELEKEQVDLDKYDELAEHGVRSAPRDLNKFSYKILRILKKEFPKVNTIIGISNHDYIIVGAVATIAYEKNLFCLIPLHFDPLLIEYGINEKNKIVLIADILGSSDQILNVVNKLEEKNSEVLGVINRGIFVGEERIKGLTDRGLKVFSECTFAHSFKEVLKKHYKSFIEYEKRSLK